MLLRERSRWGDQTSSNSVSLRQNSNLQNASYDLRCGREVLIWLGRRALKLATYRSGGQNRVALVQAGGRLLFDLASASQRAGKQNPAFRSMLDLVDGGDAALDEASNLFDRYR